MSGDDIVVREGPYPTGGKWTLAFAGTADQPIVDTRPRSDEDHR